MKKKKVKKEGSEKEKGSQSDCLRSEEDHVLETMWKMEHDFKL